MKVNRASNRLSIYLGEMSSVEIGHHGVRQAKAMRIGNDGFRSILVGIVRNQNAGVAHQRTDVGGLSTWRCAHVQNALVDLWSQSHDRQKTRRTLQHVVPAEILGRGTDGHLAVVDDEAHFRPFIERINVDTAIDQRLR